MGLTLTTGVAQLVEHRSPKPSVESSSLSTRASRNKELCSGILLITVRNLTTSLSIRQHGPLAKNWPAAQSSF